QPLDDDQDAHRGEEQDRRRGRCPAERPIEAQLDRDAEQGAEQQAHAHGDEEGQPEHGGEQVDEVGAEGEGRPVRQVEDVRHVEDQGEADGDERVQAADGEPDGRQVQQQLEHATDPAAGSDSAAPGRPSDRGPAALRSLRASACYRTSTNLIGWNWPLTTWRMASVRITDWSSPKRTVPAARKFWNSGWRCSALSRASPLRGSPPSLTTASIRSRSR